MKSWRWAIALASAATLVPTVCPAAAIVPDGEIGDWRSIPFVRDTTGDSIDSERDLLEVAVTGTREFLYLRVLFDRETTIDERPGLWLLLDADADSTTGDPDGVELRWDVGARRGGLWVDGEERDVIPGDLGMVVAPTITGRHGEACLPRALPSGGPRWVGPRVRLRIVDEIGGDRFPDAGWQAVGLGDRPTPIHPIPLERHQRADLRVVGWNLRHDALFPRPGETDARARTRFAAQSRLLTGLDFDLMIVCEAWNHDAREVLDRIAELSGRDLSGWSTGPSLGGAAILSRWPVRRNWEVHVTEDRQRRPRRVVAVHVATDAHDLLVVGNHWPCCDEDAKRQESADALVAFLRDAQTPGGRVTMPEGYGVVLAGDFNLVGDRRQLITLEQGDVLDEARFGPDALPGPGGTRLRAAFARHNDANFVHTWSDPHDPFYPGRLDWIFYGPVQLEELRSFTLDTRTLDDETLARHGIRRGDSPTTSDHSPVIADFRWR